MQRGGVRIGAVGLALGLAGACGDGDARDDPSFTGLGDAGSAPTGQASATGESAGTAGAASDTTAVPSGTVGSDTIDTPTGTSTTQSATQSETGTGALPLLIDLPLVDEAATIALVESYGGWVQGGVFGPDGWTTQTRDDIIVIPLPAGTDTSVGVLEFSASNFEWDLTELYWEAWVLVSLDSEGFPYSSTDAGVHGGLQSLYQGYNPDDPTLGYRPVAYFNLLDPACPGWEQCTAEAKPSPFWLSADGSTYTLGHAWEGPVDQLSFAGNGIETRTIDLTETSPGGQIAGEQMFLMINACGGSTVNTCGPWGGPAELKGGPVGVTYSGLTLDLSP